MDSERTDRLAALLLEAQQAHGKYEATELNGVFDEEWPQWYASYAVDHGLAQILGREVAEERVGRHLATAYAEYEQVDPKPDGTWATYIAERWPEQL
jgi:hypothetical protein